MWKDACNLPAKREIAWVFRIIRYIRCRGLSTKGPAGSVGPVLGPLVPGRPGVRRVLLGQLGERLGRVRRLPGPAPAVVVVTARAGRPDDAWPPGAARVLQLLLLLRLRAVVLAEEVQGRGVQVVAVLDRTC